MGLEAYKADDASTVEIRGVAVAKTVDSPIAKIRGTIVGIDMRIVSGLIMILQVIVGGGCYLLMRSCAISRNFMRLRIISSDNSAKERKWDS